MNRLYIIGILLAIGAGFFSVIRVSQAGINKIKVYEALRLEPYQDASGKWHIGYGHLLLPGEWYDSITQEKAEQLLKQDLQIAEKAIKESVTVPLKQPQYDALVSFVYNVGITNFKKSTLLKKLNAGDYAGAAAEFPKWKYAEGKVIAGLIKRREHEQALFLSA